MQYFNRKSNFKWFIWNPNYFLKLNKHLVFKIEAKKKCQNKLQPRKSLKNLFQLNLFKSQEFNHFNDTNVRVYV